MGRIVVDVMLKPEILDPQGQAVRGALPRLGLTDFTDVRQGKRFVLSSPSSLSFSSHRATTADSCPSSGSG